MKRIAFWCCVLAIIPLNPLTAQLPGGYHLGRASAAPDSLVDTLAKGHFRVTIRRVAHSPQERDLIAAAERLYPSRDTLLAAAPVPRMRERILLVDSLMATDSLAGTPRGGSGYLQRSPGDRTERWWWDIFDGTWSPYAVTGAAVDYYLARIRDVAAGRGWFLPSNAASERGSFEYTATVERTGTGGAAYIVHLAISWEYECGMLCGIQFAHVRTVWFDAEGKVLRISGDGFPMTTVS